MRTVLRDLLTRSVFLSALFLFPSLSIPQTTSQQTTPLSEDNLSPGEFTTIMKDAWSFVKDEYDNYIKAVGTKTEFETTAEFDKRSIEARRQYLTNITKYTKDHKFDQRIIGVLFQASLDQYDADNQVYSVTSPVIVEAPYNLPSISTEILSNPYVGLADSIRKGYRTSSIYLKFSPNFRWQVARDIAQAAKSASADIVFKVRFMINLDQGNTAKGARFGIVPKQIIFFNQRTNTVFWEQKLR